MTRFSARRVTTVLGSQRCFWLITALLMVQALWIALSGLYPMAFDEDFHLGIIRLYAHHPWPWWAGQPMGSGVFGPLSRDPSYLYHYLMSFPYHLISLCTSNQTIQVILLRLINIGLFAGGLVLWRRLLLQTGASRAIINLCLLLFVLLPIVPLLAAQINYDNLLMPLVAGVLLLTTRFNQQLAKRDSSAAKTLLQLVILCLLTSIVKYAFLPLCIVVLSFVAIKLVTTHRRASKPAQRPLRVLYKGFRQLDRVSRWGLLLLLMLSAVLFSERYGVNLIRYHTPVPDCGQVLVLEECSLYGPWIRDYNFAADKADTGDSPVTFMHEWLYGMWLRTFFAVDGPTTQFQTRGPLTVPGIAGIGIAVIGAAAIIVAGRQVWRRYDRTVLGLGLAGAGFYVVVLWLTEYQDYVHTGVPVAINGRYLLPVLLPVMLVGALALNEVIKRWPRLKLTLTVTAVLSLVWGGGALTYILRSNDAWYWPSPAVRTANHAVQRVVGPLTPGYSDPVEFLR